MLRPARPQRGRQDDPDLLFLDGPTTGLDTQSRRQLWDVVNDLKATGRTVLLTTHYRRGRAAVRPRGHRGPGQGDSPGTPNELIRQIGGEHVIDFTVPDAAAIPADEFNRLPSVYTARATGGGNYTLSVTEPHVALPAVMNWLRERNTTLLGLSTRHTTLEDVFVTLTGRHLRDGD